MSRRPRLGVTAWAVVALVAVPAAAQQARTVDLMEFRIDGNTKLPQRDVEAAVYGFLGPHRTAEDVEKARAALEDLYAKRGFATVSVTVPPQSASDGVVLLRVIERPIGRLRVVGARYVAPDTVRAATPSLAPGNVPNMSEVQSDLVTLNQLPDRTVTPALRAGRDPDTVDVDLKVEDHLPLHASLELNNRRSVGTTPLRLNGSLSYDNLWQRGDSASICFQVAPERPADAQIATAGYTWRVPDSRMSVSASYTQSNSNISTLGGTTVVGKGKIVGVRVLTPFDGNESFSHSLSAGLDYKRLTENVGVSGQFTNSPVTYVPFTATYEANWSGAGNPTDASATLVWAFRGIGSNFQEFQNKRDNAAGNFAYLKADFSHTHTLPYGIEAYAHGQMQVSPVPLVSSEQISLGGVDSVRGYFESEALGDYGAAGQFELRTPRLARYIGGPVSDLRLHAFFDTGSNEVRSPSPEVSRGATLASTGVGASLRLFDHIGGEIDDAEVLLRGPSTKSGANRVLFRLNGDF